MESVTKRGGDLLLVPTDENDTPQHQEEGNRRDPQSSPSPTESTCNTSSTTCSSYHHHHRHHHHHLNNNNNKCIVEKLLYNDENVDTDDNKTKEIIIPANNSARTKNTLPCGAGGGSSSNDNMVMPSNTESSLLEPTSTTTKDKHAIISSSTTAGHYQASTTTESTASMSTITLAATPIIISDHETLQQQKRNSNNNNHQSTTTTFSSFLNHAKVYWNHLEDERGAAATAPSSCAAESQSDSLNSKGTSAQEQHYQRFSSSFESGSQPNQRIEPTPRSLFLKSKEVQKIVNNLHPSEEGSYQPATVQQATSITPRGVLSSATNRVSSSNDSNNTSMTRFELTQQQIQQELLHRERILKRQQQRKDDQQGDGRTDIIQQQQQQKQSSRVDSSLQSNKEEEKERRRLSLSNQRIATASSQRQSTQQHRHQQQQQQRQQQEQALTSRVDNNSVYASQQQQQAKESVVSSATSDDNGTTKDVVATNTNRIREQFILQQSSMAKNGSGNVGDVITWAAAGEEQGDLAASTTTTTHPRDDDEARRIPTVRKTRNGDDASVVFGNGDDKERNGLAATATQNLQDASYPSQQAKTIYQLTAMDSQGSNDAAFRSTQESFKEGYGKESSLHNTAETPSTEGNQDNMTNDDAAEKHDENRKNCSSSGTSNSNSGNNNNSQQEQVQPGAYSQAPGKNCRRNRSIRNSVISQHSMSAKMSHGGELFGASCPNLGFQSSSTNSNIGNASFSTMSASYNSRDAAARFHPRGHRSKKRNSYQSKQSTKQSIDEELLSEDEEEAETSAADFYDHDRQRAAMLSDLLDFSSDEEDEGLHTGHSSSLPPSRDQHNTISRRQTDHIIKNSPSNSVSCARAPSPPSSPPIKRIRHTKRCISGKSQGSEISIMTEEGTASEPFSSDFIIGSPPSSSAADLFLGSDLEEEKVEIASVDNHSGGDLSTVASLSGIPPYNGRIPVPGTAVEQIRQQQQPVSTTTTTKFSPSQRTLNHGFTSSRRFLNLSSYGGSSVHSRQRRKLSLLSENSSILEDFSSGSGSNLSLMTELKSRTSSTGGSSSMATTTTTMAARQSAGRIARNLSLYMRSGALPVAATVVEGDDALESELRQQLELEIRKELEIEMEEFRRYVVLQVVGAAEPVTANVISVNSSRQNLAIPPMQGMEMSVEMASLQAGLRERERREAAAVRSSMNRELGRMYIDMKRGQRAPLSDQYRLFGSSPGSDNSNDVFDDEEMQMQGSNKVIEESNGGTTWDRVWLVVVLALLSGILLGMGIMAAASGSAK